MQKELIYDGWLVFAKNGSHSSKLTARLMKSEPSLQAGELAMPINVNLPGVLFERPRLSAKIMIPADKVPENVFNANISTDIENVIKEKFNLDVQINIGELPVMSSDEGIVFTETVDKDKEALSQEDWERENNEEFIMPVGEQR